eukprot:SAG31_NODE_12179_length_961_cov_0.853828_3_plen_110_part_00
MFASPTHHSQCSLMCDSTSTRLLKVDPSDRIEFEAFFGHPLLALPTPAATDQAAARADSLLGAVESAEQHGDKETADWVVAANAAVSAAMRASQMNLEQLALLPVPAGA